MVIGLFGDKFGEVVDVVVLLFEVLASLDDVFSVCPGWFSEEGEGKFGFESGVELLDGVEDYVVVASCFDDFTGYY